MLQIITMATIQKIISSVNIEERQKLTFSSGDTVRVTQKVKEASPSRKGGAEADKTRLQAFEGIVLARKHGTEPGATFTVRKVSGGIGIERTFPLYSPAIEKIDVISRSKTRRAKLYFVRKKAVKTIQKKLRKTRFEEKESAAVVESADTQA